MLGEAGSIAAIERKLRDAGIKLLDIEAIWLGPETDVAALRAALEAGKRLGARYVLVVGNDHDHVRLRDRLGSLCAMAAPLELTVVLEFITYCAIDSLERAAALIGDVHAPNAGFLIDALQFFRSDAQPADLTRHDPSLFAYVQLCDGPLRAPATLDERRIEVRENSMLPGHGELPVHALLAALPPGLPISLEAPSRALRNLEFLTQGRIAGEALRSFLAATPVRSMSPSVESAR